MTAAQTKAARRKVIARYGKGKKRSVAEAIQEERSRAARMAAASKKK